MVEKLLDIGEKYSENEYPKKLNLKIIEEWAEGIPVFSENDPKNPEWRATKTVPLDLGSGHGEIIVKDESDIESNPTQTIKDRAAWELATLYRDFARITWLKYKSGKISQNEIENFSVPRISLITAGNEGRAVAERFKKHNLPKPKLIVSNTIDGNIYKELQKLYAEIYPTDLSIPLAPADIKRISNNETGLDITSLRSIEPGSIFYDWHVHEGFNEKPNEVFLPYGSGRLMANYLYWQAKSLRGNSIDPRLKISQQNLAEISILGAEPLAKETAADKLYAEHKPFSLLNEHEIEALRSLQFTGQASGVYKTQEQFISTALEIMKKKGIDSEASAAAGLALYLQLHDQGKINQESKILIVNTGSGLVAEK